MRLHGVKGSVGGSVANFSLEPRGDVGLGHAGEVHRVLLRADEEGTLWLLVTHVL